MRTRIALCAALAATFIIAKTVDVSTHSGTRTTNLVSLRQPIRGASFKGANFRAAQILQGSVDLFAQAIRSDGASLSKSPAPTSGMPPTVAKYFSTLVAFRDALIPPPPPPPPPAPAPPAPAATSPGADVGAWQRVASCEEGGNDDPTYGYYGITPGSWAAYGGTQYASTAGGATQEQQVAIADRISGGAVPDANGCSGW
jgi:hypothetical protein